VLAGVLALLAWTWAVIVADPTRMGDLGLISVLPWPYFVGIGLLSGAFAWALIRPNPVIMISLTALLITYLFGTASAVEPVARMSVSWYHAGLSEWIAVHGQPLPPVDARASWPGTFSLTALVMHITGVSHASDFLRWAPPAFELLYLAPLRVIARTSGVSDRAGWLGTLIFYSANWIEQDYFSPQALNMLFYLAVIATVLAFWRPSPLVLTPRRWRWQRAAVSAPAFRRWSQHRFSARGRLGSPVRQMALVGIIVVVLTACVVSHQLTPYALLLALTACYLTRRLPGPDLPIILAVLAVGWLSLAAEPFWSGHLDLMFGGFGRVRSSMQDNVAARINGAPAHEMIVRARILMTVALMGLACLGVLLHRRMRQGRSLELLTVAPFGLLTVLNYGGEGLMRIVLFSLPFASLLAGVSIAPLLRDGSSSRVGRFCGAAAIAAVLTVSGIWLTLVRGGNDPYVSFSREDRSAVLQAYGLLRPGQTIAFYAPYVPASDRELGRYNVLLPNDDSDTMPPNNATDQLLRARPDYVLFTGSQQRWGELVRGWRHGWLSEVTDRFRAAGYEPVPTAPSVTLLRAPHTGSPPRGTGSP
jgi:hypothetical protein